MRAYFEELETRLLSPYACLSNTSRGRRFDELPSATRTCFQRDRDRIIHSKSFRRLKHKTQVFITTESDHYRSRLTHTIEVAQISRHLSRMLRINEDLAEAIALAHDLGHTPFGHSGERALNELMADHGGFEHNFQSLRIVDFLEKKYPMFNGLNLSFEVKAGLLKHKTPWDSPDTTLVDFTSLEAQVCDLSDEIAYNNHDIDDGLRSYILSESELDASVALWREAKATVKKNYSSLDDNELIHLAISSIISTLIGDVYTHSLHLLKSNTINSLEDVCSFGQRLISFSPEIRDKNRELRKFLYAKFYKHPHIADMNEQGQEIVRYLFKEFERNPDKIPTHFKQAFPSETLYRQLADYIAGMTDTYAQKKYESLKNTTV